MIALENGLPFIHHSDQVVQYIANAYVDLLKAHDTDYFGGIVHDSIKWLCRVLHAHDQRSGSGFIRAR